MLMRTIQFYIRNTIFTYYGKKVMTYRMTKKTPFMFPTERYLNVIKRGYKDCLLDVKFLHKALKKNF